MISRRLAALGLAALAVLLALVLGGCGAISQTPAPSQASTSSPASAAASGAPGASGSPAAGGAQDIVTAARAIEAQVVGIRGLAQKAAVDPKVVDSATMAAFIEQDYDKENPATQTAADERLAKLLGLLPQGASLNDLNRQLLTSQVVGLYSPDDKVLYVLQANGGMGPSERMIYSHEFTHALQDQAFDLTAFDKANRDKQQGDQSLAATSLVEGDAQSVMTVWAQSNLTIDELLKVAQDASDPKAAAIMAGLPVLLRETALFPYQQGGLFVTNLIQGGGWPAVDKAFAAPPQSSEQVMHYDKYVAHDKPVVLTMPEGLADRMGTGWSIGTQDTFGEFQLSIWLRGASGVSTSAIATAAAGWGGDRLALLDGPAGARGAVMLTAWDTASDAKEFADAARGAVASYSLSAEVVYQSGSKAVTVVVGSDDATTSRLHVIFGAGGV